MAHFANGRLVALGQLLDEVVGVGDLGGVDDLGQVEAGVATADVVGDGVVEDQVVLHDHADLRPQRVDRDPAQVVAVDADFPRRRVEEARQQVKEGVLLHLVRPDQADFLARLDREADRLEQLAPRARLVQGHVVEVQLLIEGRQEFGAHRLADFAGPVEEAEHDGRRLAGLPQHAAVAEPVGQRQVEADEHVGDKREGAEGEEDASEARHCQGRQCKP